MPPKPSAERAVYVVCPGGRTATGGMCRMVDYFMSEWTASGRQPALRCIDSTGPYIKWRQPFHYAAALAVVSLAASRGKIAALHLHTADGGSVLRKGLLIGIAQQFDIPVIVHMHAATFAAFWARMPPWVRRWTTTQFRKATWFVVLGNADRRFYTDVVGVDPARVVVVHNAVPCPPWAALPAAATPCHLLFAGILSERKGLAELIVALAELRALPWRLVVAGNGDAGPWQRMAAAHGLAERIEFLGWVDNAALHRLLDAADVLVLPSHAEGLPMILLEAMAHGRPVLASDVGSVTDAVEDGVSGLLVPPRDPRRLAAALRRLIVDPTLRARLGAAARDAYQERFTIERFNAALATLFASAIHG